MRVRIEGDGVVLLGLKRKRLGAKAEAIVRFGCDAIAD